MVALVRKFYFWGFLALQNKDINEAVNETACLVLLREFQVRTYLVQELSLHLSLVVTVIRPVDSYMWLLLHG